MSPPLWSWFLLFAAGQGLLLAVVLWWSPGSRDRRQANRLLAALVLAFSLIITDAWFNAAGLLDRFPHATAMATTLPLLMGPLLYLYLGALLHGRRVGRQEWRHFLPWLLAVLAWSPYYLQSADSKRALTAATHAIPWYVSLFALAKLGQFFAYFLAARRLLKAGRAEAPDSPLLRGIDRLMSGLGLGALGCLALFASEHLPWTPPLSSDTLGALVLTGFIVGLAALAIHYPVTYRLPDPAPARPRYAETRLPESERRQYLERLERCMTGERPWLDGDLKLEQLAERLAMTPHDLSQLVNDTCGANFQDYLNRHRVEALKTRLSDPADRERSILELALAVGFNSKSALNRAFKKHTGLTPSEYRRNAGTEPAA